MQGHGHQNLRKGRPVEDRQGRSRQCRACGEIRPEFETGQQRGEGLSIIEGGNGLVPRRWLPPAVTAGGGERQRDRATRASDG